MWFITDPAWREKYLESTKRKQAFRTGQRRAMRKLIAANENQPLIMNGPFKGMIFPPSTTRSSFSAQMLLGTYEKEIHSLIEEACQQNYKTIIDIGAAEGFFACGMAMKCPDSRVVAFESELHKHSAIRSCETANGIANLEIRGFCDKRALDEIIQPNNPTLLIVDIDGGEKSLLDPDEIPILKNVDMLIETHDMFVEGVTEEIIARFSHSHEITAIDSHVRTLSDIPPNCPLDESLALKAMDEFRGQKQTWLFATVKR